MADPPALSCNGWGRQVERAAAAGVTRLIVTGGCLEDAKVALALVCTSFDI